MILLVSDTSVLIDLERGGLLSVAFATGNPMLVPDLLYAKELEPYNGAYYRSLGLQVVNLQPDELSFAQQVKNERKPLSLPDCFALACAARPDHVLLTGDGALRTAAKDYGIQMVGLLWLLDGLAESGAATYSTLHEGLTKISQGPRCRLPKNEIQKRLKIWSA
jgi:predicted nucleic acid-binding protein